MGEPRIIWTAPRGIARPKLWRAETDLDLDDVVAASDDADASRATLAILAAGVPSVQDATTPREDAIGLLMLAAEVEHALMTQYLYAGQSLRGAQARTINRVAIQEMGHLLTVQNLLLALNGANADDMPGLIHLGRDGLRRASSQNPLPVILEPVSKDALGKFVVVERPHVIPDPALAGRIAELERQAAQLGVSVNPVYALYAAIRWIFQADDTADALGLSTDLGLRTGWHLEDGDIADPAVIARFAAEPEEWGSIPQLIVARVRDRAEGLAALDEIAAQGEGLSGAAKSHFTVFLDLLDQFEAGGVGVKPMPRTPRKPGQPPSEDIHATEITNAYTILWADLFDSCYELLLVDIAWALSHEHGEIRDDLVALCVRTMGSVIQPVAKDLAARPIDIDSAATSGPPYHLADETIPATRAGFRLRFGTCLGRQRDLIDAIRQRPEFSTDLFATLRLSAIASVAAARLPHLPQGA